MTAWKALANSIAHGETPLGIARMVVWRCEECGGREFRVLAWEQWTDGDEDQITNNRFALKCLGCGRVEANQTVSVGLW